jgi:hypothetical protein
MARKALARDGAFGGTVGTECGTTLLAAPVLDIDSARAILLQHERFSATINEAQIEPCHNGREKEGRGPFCEAAEGTVHEKHPAPPFFARRGSVQTG